MKPILIELTAQEAQWFLQFIDAGLKAGGVQALTQANALHAKLTAALQADAATTTTTP